VITLNGIDLGEDLIWTDRYAWSPVLQTQRMTIGGGLNIFSEPTNVLRPVTLFASENQGWMIKSVVDSLRSLSADPTQSYLFNFHNLETFLVRFKHYEPPALDLKPLVDGGELGQWFIGTIKLFSI